MTELYVSPGTALGKADITQHIIFSELLHQTKLYACSGGVWTETTDVEGEVNGLVT